MKLFEIPTHRVPVRVVMGANDEMQGALFVPETGPDGQPATLDQRLNDESDIFLAMSVKGGGVLLHRPRIAAVHGDVLAEETPGGLVRGAQVEVDLVGGVTVGGRIVYSMPEGRERLIDYLNVAPRFVALCTGDGTTWFNRDLVVRVRLLEEPAVH